MRKSLPLCRSPGKIPLVQNIIQINHGTFYRHHPSVENIESSASNPALFRDLTFELPAKPLEYSPAQQHWAVVGASGTTTFLEILRGTHLCLPPNARSFPFLSSDEIDKKDHRLRTPSRAIQHVGFNGAKAQGLGSGIRGAYLSARYESRREETDWPVLQYLKGETDLNPAVDQAVKHATDVGLLDQVITDLRLEKLVSMPVSNLSNGQTRRARIAKALLGKPELLLLDEPFMGLDPPTLVTLSPILRDLAYKSTPRLLLALRPQDPIPDWITHLAVLGAKHTVALMGKKSEVLFALHRWADMHDNVSKNIAGKLAVMMTEVYGPPLLEVGHSLTPNGILRYSAYEEAKSNIPDLFDKDGIVNGRHIGQERMDQRTKAMKEPHDGPTTSQMLMVTAAVPATSEAASALGDTPSGSSTSSRSALSEQNTSQSSLSSLLALTHDEPLVREPLIELSGVVVKYGSKAVLGATTQRRLSDGLPNTDSTPGLHLTIYRGSRMALLGANGSGKTTLLSLLTSDHPQSYSLPIKFFGRSRLPSAGKPGLSLWDIQSRTGHSSPEIHAFFPRRLSIRRVLESAWADTFAAKPKLTSETHQIVDAFLRWWEPELRESASHHPVATAEKQDPILTSNAPHTSIVQILSQSYPPVPATTEPSLAWATSPSTTFGTLSFPTQRLLLLLRAMIRSPDILILDEAFSGLSPEVREKAMLFLQHGEMFFLQRRLVGSGDGAKAQKGVQEAEETGSHYALTKTRNMRAVAARACRTLGLPSLQALLSHRENADESQLRRSIPDLSRDDLLAAVGAAAVADAKREGESESGVDGLGPEFKFTGLNEGQALVVVSHVREEVPPFVDEWVRLPGEEEVSELGRGVEMGRGELRSVEGWGRVWGM